MRYFQNVMRLEISFCICCISLLGLILNEVNLVHSHLLHVFEIQFNDISWLSDWEWWNQRSIFEAFIAVRWSATMNVHTIADEMLETALPRLEPSNAEARERSPITGGCYQSVSICRHCRLEEVWKCGSHLKTKKNKKAFCLFVMKGIVYPINAVINPTLVSGH
jgi:hypothetical protein